MSANAVCRLLITLLRPGLSLFGFLDITVMASRTPSSCANSLRKKNFAKHPSVCGGAVPVT